MERTETVNNEEGRALFMKTTVKELDYEKVMALPRPKHQLPHKPNLFWRLLIRFLIIFGMMGTRFQYETEGFAFPVADGGASAVAVFCAQPGGGGHLRYLR